MQHVCCFNAFCHVSNTDIRIPLEWKEFESRKGKLGKTVPRVQFRVLLFIEVLQVKRM